MRQKHAMEHTSLVVLHLLSREDMYGYQMISETQANGDVWYSVVPAN